MNKQNILDILDMRSFFQEFVKNLRGYPQAAGLCPFHDDHKSSLSVDLKSGLYNCFSCGAKGDVFRFYMDLKDVGFKAALKEIAEMQGITNIDIKPKVVAAFGYKDSEGKTIYIKERLEPGRDGRSKEFRFKHFNGDRWCSGREHAPVIFNLPQIIKSEYCFIVEGEAKAELLSEWGLPATCLDTGANSSWRDEYTKFFENKEKVILLPDNDNPGMSYALKIANAISRKVPEIKIVELPGIDKGGDVIDWSRIKGNDKSKLIELIKKTSEWKPSENIEVDRAEEIPGEALTFPSSAWRGVFDTYRKAMDRTTWASDVTHFITLWTVVSAKLRRKVKFCYGMDLYPNVYLVFFGDSGDKKTTATSKIVSLLTDDPAIKVLQGIGSGEGLVEWLKPEDDAMSHLLYLSELAELLQRGKWNGSTLKTVLTHIYDCPHAYEAPFRQNPIKIVEPTLTLLACTTPTWFWMHSTELDVYGGFANRILYLTGQPKDPIARPIKPDADMLCKIKEHIDKAIEFLPQEAMELDFDVQANELWEQFYLEWHKKDWDPLVKEGIKRVDAYVLKLAMVYAVLEGTVPTITYDQLLTAIQVGEYAAKCAEMLILKHQLKSNETKLEQRIMEILRKGDCTRRTLQQLARGNWTCREFNRTIDALEKAEQIYHYKGVRWDSKIYTLQRR